MDLTERWTSQRGGPHREVDLIEREVDLKERWTSQRGGPHSEVDLTERWTSQ